MSSRTQQFNTRQHMQRNTYEIFRYKDAFMKEVALHHHDFYELYFFLSGNAVSYTHLTLPTILRV